ncbi:glutaredoxin 3 [Pseudomonas aeruginosa]|uniref:glutaredoxin 3 n=1 Tax=Pseudomonas aeruginosa TaxID=287 RepID=UPI000EAE4D87|nr:glutaredoxin 3 [Pseudomonas aeruginosa]ELV1374427.1 glutaredoxin 3 [Pseudomonas aeruginosa]MCX3418228.1 glutaredoxin 3 [Pseudomonas aeruginosa]MDE9770661.1 glutaredoxin 3 [Pseudomonas aeruginosa]TSC48399.1 glutaredoxin 3 [Pseudomonas aeruginosa]HBO3125463.1 glutaredoxin 3 [Pseudomonas aeruginosa]
MSQITLYTSQHCPYCHMAEQLLVRRAAGPLTKIRVDLDSLALISMIARTGRRTVPQIFIGDRHVGGYDDLARLDAAGELSPLLAAGQ